MKRFLVSAIVIVAMFAAFTTGAFAQSKKTVTVWNYWETPKHQETLARVCKDFNSSQSTIEVVTKYIPFADFKKQLSIGAAASELPDIVIIDNPDHASYSAMGIFADITDKLASWPDLKQYFEGPLNSCRLNGRLYGIPFGSNCLSLYYNEDMLKAAGANPPKTWDELKSVALKTTRGNVHGFGISSVQNEEGTFGFLCFLWGSGNTSFQINNANGVRALTLVRDLVKSGAMPKEVINWTQGDVMNQFISGNLAMMVNGPWQVPTMREQAPNLKWNVVQLPVGAKAASDLGGENFGVVKGDKVDEAIAFLKFVASPAEMKSYINDFGYIASRKDVAATQFTNDPIMKVFAAQMASAKPRGPHPRWPEISDALSLAMNESITGIAAPDAAAAKAQKAIDAIVSAQ
ncbi:MAG TPA: sugar ABC transporter substrate-binding protein [Spirochaetia bacterium]|nr:sugar ABC transporter substrate-binding protein [Spirochaetia bacterium]